MPCFFFKASQLSPEGRGCCHMGKMFLADNTVRMIFTDESNSRESRTCSEDSCTHK